MESRFRRAALALSVVVGGCAQAADFPRSSAVTKAAPVQIAQAPVAAQGNVGGEPPVPVVAEAMAERKIIFNGTLDVEVKDFAAAYEELQRLMQRHQAFFTKTEIRGDSGQKRTGAFTIKVPVAHFQTLVNAVAALGNPLRNSTDSQDVTEEYVDVEARIRNLKAEEEVLNRLLKDVGTKLDDLFRIREQVRQNRQMIEQAEARLNVLGKLTSLSTITLTLRDHEEYVAPAAVAVTEPPSFRDRAVGTWATSLGRLRAVGEAIAIALIAIAPWSPLLLLAGLTMRWGGRRLVARLH